MNDNEKDPPVPSARAPYSTPRIDETESFQHLVLTCARGPGWPDPDDICPDNWTS